VSGILIFIKNVISLYQNSNVLLDANHIQKEKLPIIVCSILQVYARERDEHVHQMSTSYFGSTTSYQREQSGRLIFIHVHF